MSEPTRCDWGDSDPLTRDYHDQEWGVPIHDRNRLFELLCLEGAQAGLAWITILRKRETYRAAFDGFDPERIASYTDADRARLMADAGIVRNRAKIDAFIGNARALDHVEDFWEREADQQVPMLSATAPLEKEMIKSVSSSPTRQ